MASADNFARELEALFSADRALYVPRAALGLMAALRCWRQHAKICKIALPAAICHEVLLAVYAAGCQPVFCDVDASDGLVRKHEWIRARSLGADVAIVVHLYGNPACTREVRAIFPSPQCLVVDDAAQALGSRTPDGLCGAMGDVGLLSFGATKHISLGNAAVLFRDRTFADEVGALLEGVAAAPEQQRAALHSSFRERFDLARARLTAEGEAAAGAFTGLLDGIDPVLRTPLREGIESDLLNALRTYDGVVRSRSDKAAQWSSLLQGTGIEPVGMAAGCVPWRYVCRLPGIDWAQQQRVADALRATGMHVSNWYLPAHWLAGADAGTLPGVEGLSREVFQFWVDDAATELSIGRDAAAVRQQVFRLRDRTGV